MFKLISFQGFSGLAVNALERIEKALTPLGLEKTEKYDDTDELLDAIVDSIDEGDTVAVTAEKNDYNSVKKQIISTFSLNEEENEEIRDIISKSAHGTDSTDELEEHCLMPSDGDVYITDDGFYSGFCVEFSNGARLIFFLLDEEKFGDIRGYIENEMMPDRAPDYEDEYFGNDEGEEENDEAFDSGIFAAMVAQEKAEMGTEIPEYNDAETEENAKEGEDVSSEESSEEIAEEESSEETADEGETEENTEEAAEEQNEEASEDGEQSEEDNPADETPLPEEENGEGIPENAEDEEGEEPDEEVKEDTEEAQSEADEDLSGDEKAEEINLTGFEEALSSAEKAIEALSKIDKRVAYIAGETSPIMLAMENEIDDLSTCFTVCEANIENEDALEIQVAMAKKARLAIEQNDVDYAVAVSPVITTEKDGKELYYSYIVFHDGVSAKAKKVSTTTKQGIESLIPHAFAVMFGLTERKAIHVSQLESDEIVETEDDEKKKKVLMLTVCIAAAVVAVASAIIMVWSYFKRTPEILITTNPYDTNPSSTSPSTTINDNTSVPITDPQFNYPAEPTAGDISNVPSSTPFSSTKGNFTFTVYGYGHGVGMSQTGADYYANMGKSYLEILSIYYYGATLVLGDTAPETVNFGGNEYTLRDYLATAVESEMGENYSPEALKAQAVAIYTFAKYYNFDVPSTLHAFDKKPSKAAYAAVDVVAGQYMIYNGEVIKPYFHATSAGKTASYSNTFGDSHIPYLAGGRPSYGDVNANNYCTTVTYTSDELNSLIYSKTGTSLSGDPANWIKILSHDGCIDQSTGYVSKVQVGEQIYTGYDFRMKVLGGALRSHCFTFIYTPTA